VLQVGVKALLQNKAGKYLLLRRNREKYKDIKGDWDIPGGRITPGTPHLENLKREIKEETGLNLEGELQLLAAQDILRIKGRHVVRLTYVGEIEGEPNLDTSENLEFRWFSLAELKGLGDDLDVYLKELVDKGVV